MGETESTRKGGGEMAWKNVLKYPEEEKCMVRMAVAGHRTQC